MNKMDAFVNAMKVAFVLSQEIEGISNIRWNLEYHGTSDATQEIAQKIASAMKETGFTVD